MAQPRDALDLRRAAESVVLDALAVGHPLALAEAYHRSVPAAHAVARRLVSGADEVESLLLDVYTRMWVDGPSSGPLEAWVRGTTWAIGVERLRAEGRAPASPSTAGLLPDLPAPDVRFLDAAERAIAELPDDERRALLLAHDKGVPSALQEAGAADALTRALMGLAGPETSSSDRAALHEDGCDDVGALGDWCLGVADAAAAAEITAAIESRAGCAAKSRAVRRGRRRIEGLPATPDMGQRILVTVLTGAGAGAPAVDAAPAVEDAAVEDAAVEDAAVEDEPTAAEEQAVAAPADDPFAELDPTGPMPLVDESTPAPTAADEEDPFKPVVDDGPEPAAVSDTADLPQAGEGAPAEEPTAAEDWRPDPGSTAELRLSDILAEGDDEDDPFAGLDDEEDAEPAPTGITSAGTRDPYAALQDLGGEEPAPAAPRQGPVVLGEDEDLVGGYVEGQDAYGEPAAVGGPSRTAAILSWVLPILGGSAIGILVAIQVFGLPG